MEQSMDYQDTFFIVNEIFASINGEGTLAGELAIFIRLAGCNLDCSYCDTKYAQKNDDGTKLSVSDILNKISQYKNIKNITLTGGEPLFRKNIDVLLKALTDADYIVNIETNGSIKLQPFVEQPYSNKLIFCCDYKLPSSNAEKFMNLSNLELLRPNDVLKFVIGTQEDLDKISTIQQTNNIQCYTYLSAVFNKMETKQIVEWLLTQSSNWNTNKTRVQLQLHKYIWDPNLTGV